MLQPKKGNPAYIGIYILPVLILLGLALYIIPLHSTFFYFDDISSVQSNEAIRTIDLPRIFNAFNTRFLAGLSFALNYRWCGLDPAGYRLINVLIHCLNAFLAYLLVKELGDRHRKAGVSPLAYFASLLFLCHPIQTEAVNYITQRFVLMGALFYLLTLYLYIQYRTQYKKRFLIAGLFSALAAMLCKEFTVTLPVMLTLYDFYFLRGETAGKRFKNLLPFFIIALIVPFLLLRTPSDAIGVANIADTDAIHHVDITRAQGDISRRTYFLTELNVVRTYVRLLFLPIHQNLDYDYPLTNGIDAKTLLSGFFLLCLLAVAALTFKSYRMASFGILWFFIALSVESSIIPINHVIAEYRLYLASVGFVFLISSLINARQAALILIVCSVLTFQRNNVWRDDLSLWDATIQESPHKARPYNNRGLAWARQGNLSQAMADYNKAIEADPHYINAYINRGFTYNKEGDFTKALSDFNQAIKLNPKLAGAYTNRGNTYYYQGDLTHALADYNKAIVLDGKSAETYNDRANAYLKLNNIAQAIADYNKAITLKPNYADVYFNLGFIYYRQGQWAKAAADYTRDIAINPKDIMAYNNRAACYYQLKNRGQTLF